MHKLEARDDVKNDDNRSKCVSNNCIKRHTKYVIVGELFPPPICISRDLVDLVMEFLYFQKSIPRKQPVKLVLLDAQFQLAHTE